MLSDWRPDDEILAAFIDGKLTAGDRARVVRALASDPDRYAEFIEAARIASAAHSGEAQTSTVRARNTNPRRKPIMFAVPILAAASIGALIWLPARLSAPDTIDLMQSAPFIAGGRSGRSARALPSAWDQPRWSTVRGGRDQPARDATAARLGVRVVELEFASAVEDSAAIERIAPAVLALLTSVEGAGPAGAKLRNPTAITTAERALLARLIRTLSGAPAAFDVGAWIEMARLAAATDRTEFFATGGGARRSLRAVTTAIANAATAEQDWSDVLPHLRTIDRTSADDLSSIRLQLDSALAAFPTP